MTSKKLRKLGGTTLERTVRVKALDELGKACDAVIKRPMKFGRRRYSQAFKAGQRYLYGYEDQDS
jgi:hypothetical protein